MESCNIAVSGSCHDTSRKVTILSHSTKGKGQSALRNYIVEFDKTFDCWILTAEISSQHNNCKGYTIFHWKPLLTFSWQNSLSYSSQSIDFQMTVSIDWFLDDKDFRHERVKWNWYLTDMEILIYSVVKIILYIHSRKFYFWIFRMNQATGIFQTYFYL